MKNTLLILVIVVVGYLTFFTSCANIGMPSGGAKDSIPPFVVKSDPANNAVKVDKKDNKIIRISFNELIRLEGVNEKFVVSPPVSKRPLFRMKGKTLIVDLNDTLHKNTTYSLDFKDAVVDNNEGNRMPELRLSFSTGPILDSLRIVGFVKDAFNLEPVSNAYLLFYTGKSDTLVYKSKPNFVAKTDHRGFFAATNLPADTFQVYALSDADNNMKYTPGVDSIAFINNLVIPTAKYFPQQDTTVRGKDTLVIFGKTRFYPDPLYFLRFYEKGFNLRLEKYERTNRRYLDLFFTESVRDTFNIIPLNFEAAKKDWRYLEMSPQKDTIRVWLTDSTVYNRDSLTFKVNYLQQDSLERKYVKNDTLKFFFSEIQKGKTKRQQRKKIEKLPLSFSLGSNIKQGFDIFSDVLFSANEPIASFDTTKVKLWVKKDTLFVPVNFRINPDPKTRRRYILSHKWNFGETYRVNIDSAAVRTIYDLPSNKFNTTFKIQDEEHYGSLKIDLQNVTGPTIVQILNTTKDEAVLRSYKTDKNGEISFMYLEPQKYVIKAIYDQNKNGRWDPGDLKKKIQPEEVVYFPTVTKVRSNWDNRFPWLLPSGREYTKKIVDPEYEEEKLKNKNKPKSSSRGRAF
jgi:hypothetical protein